MPKNSVIQNKILTGEPRKQVTIPSDKSIVVQKKRTEETFEEEDVEDETEVVQQQKSKQQSQHETNTKESRPAKNGDYEQVQQSDNGDMEEIDDEIQDDSQVKDPSERQEILQVNKKTTSQAPSTSNGRNDMISSKNQQSSVNPSTLEKVQVNYNMQTGVQGIDQPSLGESVPQGVFIDYNNIEDSQTSSQPTTNLGLRK